ncbi:MAG: hypothetical protein GY838_13325 [bacterium]|nr:hypothetical protein [bacterium]
MLKRMILAALLLALGGCPGQAPEMEGRILLPADYDALAQYDIDRTDIHTGAVVLPDRVAHLVPDGDRWRVSYEWPPAAGGCVFDGNTSATDRTWERIRLGGELDYDREAMAWTDGEKWYRLDGDIFGNAGYCRLYLVEISPY